jgi:LPS-assembly lipoprotein
VLRLTAAMALAGLTAGCFQPLYGEHTFAGGPGVGAALKHVTVAQIVAPPGTPSARLAVELRNELTFMLDRGAPSHVPPTHRLEITLQVSGTSLIVDPLTAREEYEIQGATAIYRLVEIATNKIVVDSTAVQRTPFAVPGQQQRFAMLRGQRDAQSNAVKVVAAQIQARLASYFAAGT